MIEAIKKVLLKCALKIGKAIINLIKRLGGEVEQLLYDLTDEVVQTIEDLETMTIAELRVYAKQFDINLEGKRVKSEIIEVILKHFAKE